MRRRSVWAAVLGLVLSGALAGSVVTALVFPEADRSPIRHSTETVPVTATVEQRPIRTASVLSATVRAPVVAALMPNASLAGQSGSGREVVSGRIPTVGATIRFGDLVGEVSGRPVLAMPASMPLYRDLEPGLTGNDVVALQQLLSQRGYFRSSATGKFDSGTLDALSRLFRALKYDTPTLLSGQRGLPLADTTSLPRDGVRVTRAAALGTVLGTAVAPNGGETRAGSDTKAGNDAKAAASTTPGTQALAEVEVSQAVITARIDMLQAQTIKSGTPVSVRVGSSEAYPSTVQSVGDFQEAAASLPAGYDITVALPEKLVAGVKANDVATITESVDATPKGPAVPLVSVRQNADGAYVVLAGPEGGAAGARRVAVRVRGQSEGYAILEDSPDLPEGAIVLVNGDA